MTLNYGPREKRQTENSADFRGSGPETALTGDKRRRTNPRVWLRDPLVGGIPAQVVFAGQAPGFPGVEQINLSIPSDAPTGNSVSLTVKSADGTVTSNAATIAVQ